MGEPTRAAPKNRTASAPRAGGAASATPAPGGAAWWQDAFDFVKQAVAALVGLGSVLYFLGGVVLAGRLATYQLPWEIVIGQLPQSFLVIIAITEVVTPMIVIGLVYALVLLADWEIKPLSLVQHFLPGWWAARAESVRQRVEARSRPFQEIGSWVLAGLVLVVVWRLVLRSAGGWDLLPILVAVLAAAFGAAATYLILSRSAGLEWWPKGKSSFWLLAGASGVIATAFLPLLLWNAMTLPMPYAQVCQTKSVPPAGGWLIGQTSDRLILGNPDRKRRNVFMTPSTNAMIMATYKDPKTTLPPCPPVASGS